MSGSGRTLQVLPQELAICRLAAEEPVPAWAREGGLLSVTRTAEELSVVCPAQDVPAAVRGHRDWRALKVAGPLDFSLTGVLAGIAVPLADAGISIFALSTFDTDYVLVRSADLSRAVAALRAVGHTVKEQP